MRRWLALAATLTLVLGPYPPGQAEPPAAATPAAALRAQQVAQRLIQTVYAELVDALNEGTPEQAVYVCHEAAQRVTEEVAAKEGVLVRRTSLRVRNPRNAPDEFERRVLEQWETSEAKPTLYSEVVELPNGARELRYLQPIVLQPLCTSCHGTAEQITAPVRQALASHYPADQATGYQAGDLRGAISVRLPIE
jgi:hypothetical protein